jgi:hypothetical protein
MNVYVFVMLLVVIIDGAMVHMHVDVHGIECGNVPLVLGPPASPSPYALIHPRAHKHIKWTMTIRRRIALRLWRRASCREWVICAQTHPHMCGTGGFGKRPRMSAGGFGKRRAGWQVHSFASGELTA